MFKSFLNTQHGDLHGLYVGVLLYVLQTNRKLKNNYNKKLKFNVHTYLLLLTSSDIGIKIGTIQ